MALAEDVGDVRRGDGFAAAINHPTVRAALAEARRGIHIWTDARTGALRIFWAEGLSAGQIARQLCGVSRNAVIGKIHRLGLAGRASPTRPPVKRNVASRRVVIVPQRVTRARAEALTREMAEIKALAPIVAEGGRALDVLTVRDGDCKFPTGHPDEETFAFCGRAVAGQGPYCAEHQKLTHQHVPRKRRSPAAAHHAELRQLERLMAPTYRGFMG